MLIMMIKVFPSGCSKRKVHPLSAKWFGVISAHFPPILSHWIPLEGTNLTWLSSHLPTFLSWIAGIFSEKMQFILMDIQRLSLRILNFSPKPLMANYTQIWGMVSVAGTVVILQSVRHKNTLKSGESVQCNTRHFPQVLFHYFSSHSSSSKAKNFLCQFSMLFFISLYPFTPKYVFLNNAHNILPPPALPQTSLASVHVRPALHLCITFHRRNLSS